jgi:putative iron-only hydrogenase system regulator
MRSGDEQEEKMEKRVAMLAIVVEDNERTEELNHVLHEYSEYIIGRLGLPYRDRSISLISIAIDGPADAISALSGKLGQIPGVSAKAVYAKLPEDA